MNAISMLCGFLITLVVSAPIAWALVTWMSYSIGRIEYELGKYTIAYRCVKCNQVYRNPQLACGECGHEHEYLGCGMKQEVGKWHCKLSKLKLVHWWEPKGDSNG